MAKTKSITTPVPIDDIDLFCEFAKLSGQVAAAEAVRLIQRSRVAREALRRRTSVSDLKSEWTEVDYKEYPRFPSVALPDVANDKSLSLSIAGVARHSCRSFSSRSVGLVQLAKILRFAHGDRPRFTHPSRAFPSAGGLYGTETYLIADRVDGLASGIYHYSPRDHALHVLEVRDKCSAIGFASLMQPIGTPAAFFIESVRLGPSLAKYGMRGIRFAFMEIGAAAEVLDLTATADGLATLWIGGFADEDLWRLLGVSPVHELEVPLLILAVGHPKMTRALRKNESNRGANNVLG